MYITKKYQYIFEVRHDAFFSFDDEKKMGLYEVLKKNDDYSVDLSRNVNNTNDQMLHIKSKKNYSLNMNLNSIKFDAGITAPKPYEKINQNPVYDIFKNAVELSHIKKTERIGYRVIATVMHDNLNDVILLFNKCISYDNVYKNSNTNKLDMQFLYTEDNYNVNLKIYTNNTVIDDPMNVGQIKVFYNFNIDVDIYCENDIYNNNRFQDMHNRVIKKIKEVEEVVENA